MKVSKQLTINIGAYESLKVGVDEAPTFEEADTVIIAELQRLQISISDKIRQCIQWKETVDEWA
ncbi:MAG: hypothetical protein JSW60_07400 [Thermoplasmatales archaeon]|nr:MAG: hypothetical protein JSW60_07400 [Thermoplasmatales archaeon]